MAHLLALGILDAGIPLIMNMMVQDVHGFSEDFFRGYVDRCSFAIVLPML